MITKKIYIKEKKKIVAHGWSHPIVFFLQTAKERQKLDSNKVYTPIKEFT